MVWLGLGDRWVSGDWFRDFGSLREIRNLAGKWCWAIPCQAEEQVLAWADEPLIVLYRRPWTMSSCWARAVSYETSGGRKLLGMCTGPR